MADNDDGPASTTFRQQQRIAAASFVTAVSNFPDASSSARKGGGAVEPPQSPSPSASDSSNAERLESSILRLRASRNDLERRIEGMTTELDSMRRELDGPVASGGSGGSPSHRKEDYAVGIGAGGGGRSDEEEVGVGDGLGLPSNGEGRGGGRNGVAAAASARSPPREQAVGPSSWSSQRTGGGVADGPSRRPPAASTVNAPSSPRRMSSMGSSSSRASSSSEGGSGVVASLGRWFAGRKEKAERERLARLVEEQRRILRESNDRAAAARRRARRRGGGGGADGTRRRSDGGSDRSGGSAVSGGSGVGGVAVSPPANPYGGFCGLGSNSGDLSEEEGGSSSPEPGEEDDGDGRGGGVVRDRENSDGFVEVATPSRVSRVSVPRPTPSGEGAAVVVEVKDPPPTATTMTPSLLLCDDAPSASDDDDGSSDSSGSNEEVDNSFESEFSEFAQFEVSIEPEPAKKTETYPPLLTPSQMKYVAARVLPPAIAYSRWKRLYSLARDGDSFEGSFLRKVGGTGRTLLVIRTTRGEVFGGYAESPWEVQRQSLKATFYGGAQACLFRIDPSESVVDEVKTYRWTGRNRYVQICDAERKMLAFGGGGTDGEFGLAVEDDFRRGSTGRCDTFGNDPLCGQGNFDVLDVELWGFVLGVF